MFSLNIKIPKFAANLKNKVNFCEKILTSDQNPMFCLKLYIILNIFINS